MKKVVQIVPIDAFPIDTQNTDVLAVGVALIDRGENGSGLELVILDKKKKTVSCTRDCFRGCTVTLGGDLEKHITLPFAGLQMTRLFNTQEVEGNGRATD